MLRLRPYNKNDADIILSWSKDKISFYKWSAGVMGKYPISKKKFCFVENLMAFTAMTIRGRFSDCLCDNLVRY